MITKTTIENSTTKEDIIANAIETRITELSSDTFLFAAIGAAAIALV
jgi:hypothetical protein